MDAEQYDAGRAEETFYLRCRLAEAARAQPEFKRMIMTCQALRSNLAVTGGQFLLLPHEECLTAVYGEAGSRKFWEILFSESMSIPQFLRIMALLGSENGQQEQSRWLALRRAMHDAFDMGEKWLVRGTSFEDERLKIVPRPAAEWLWRNPLRCHLLPPSLAAFLEKSPADDRPPVAAVRGVPLIGGHAWPQASHVTNHIALVQRCTHLAACLELQTALQNGQVKARGPLGGSERVPVPAEFWLHAVPDHQEDGEAVNSKPGGGRLPWFEMRAEDVLAIWPLHAATSHEPESAAEAERPKNRGGRPPKWDWVAFDAEVVRLANTPDGLSERPALMRHMLDWCASNWANTPAESAVRDRIAKLRQE